MLPYWLMFILPAAVALVSEPRWSVGLGTDLPRLRGMWLLLLLALTMLIGFRVEVGGDWWNYMDRLEVTRGMRWAEILSAADPGDRVVNWISAEAGWGIFGVNIIGGGLFAYGLLTFCKAQPRPWLALAVSVPYLVIVVAMGYSRQAVALGLAMVGLVDLGRGRSGRFGMWLLLGATFHRTAVLLLPIAALSATRSRYWTAAWMAVLGFVAYSVFLEESVRGLYENYVVAEYQSQGTFLRLLMNGVPAVVMVGWSKTLGLRAEERRLWLVVSAIALALLAALLVTPSSTALDRIGLYVLPLQLVVFSRLPGVWGGDKNLARVTVTLVLSYYALVQYVWLNFGKMAYLWIPYRFYLLDS